MENFAAADSQGLVLRSNRCLHKGVTHDRTFADGALPAVGGLSLGRLLALPQHKSGRGADVAAAEPQRPVGLCSVGRPRS